MFAEGVAQSPYLLPSSGPAQCLFGREPISNLCASLLRKGLALAQPSAMEKDAGCTRVPHENPDSPSFSPVTLLTIWVLNVELKLKTGYRPLCC